MPDNTASDLETAPVERHKSVGSSNADLLDRARAGQIGPLWLRADEQTGGRGRLGRSWQSPVGNLYISLLLSNPCEARFQPQLALVAGVALADAVRSVASPLTALALKWPNDLLVDGAKISGILVEGTSVADGSRACVIGWGVNCTSCPADLPYRAEHLSAAAGRPISAGDVETALRSAMAHRVRLWNRGSDFPAIRAAWLASGPSPGAPLTIKSGNAFVEGSFEDVDESGRLLLRTSAGVRVFEAGEVVPPVPAAVSIG